MRMSSKITLAVAFPCALVAVLAGGTPDVEAASECAASKPVEVRAKEHSQMNPAYFVAGDSCKDAAAEFTIPESGKDSRVANAIGASHEFKMPADSPKDDIGRKVACATNKIEFKIEYKSKKTKKWKTYVEKDVAAVWAGGACIARDHVFFQSGFKKGEDWGSEWRVSGRALHAGKPEGKLRLTAAPGVTLGS